MQIKTLSKHAENVNRVLYAIANAANTTLDLEDLYATIHTSLGDIIDVTNFFIAIVDRHKKTLYFPYYVDTVDDDFSPISDFDTERSLTGMVVLEKKPLLLHKKQLQQRTENDGVWGPTPLIWMGVPLIIRDEVIGVIAVQSYTDPDNYSLADLELLSAVSHQTAIAIDRKHSLQNLERSEERSAFALLATGSGIWDWNIQTDEVFFDNNHYLIAGYTPGEFPSCREEWEKRVHPEDLPGARAKLQLCQNGVSDIYRSEYRYRKKNGEWMWVLSQGKVFERDAEKRPLRLTGTHTDISIRKIAEENLRKSEETYRNIFLNAQIGLFRVRLRDGKLIECNDSLARMLGYDDRLDCLSHFSTVQILPSSVHYQRTIRRLLRYGEIRNEETLFRRKDGTSAWFRHSLKHFREDNYVQGVVEDISDFKTAQEEKLLLQEKLNRSKKMEALGLLAGGVAHDLNNILAGIISYPELLLLKIDDDSDLVVPLQAIMDSGNRAATVVNDLLAIARSAASRKEIHSINTLIHDYLRSPECQQFKKLYPNLTIHTELKSNSPNINCSPVHIKKCIMNLVLNAIEAVEADGVIIIGTDTLKMHTDNGQTDIVLLTVADSGPGILKEDLDHIFEPFYTKKIMGKSGTGLGLTVVWNTMEDHKGEVQVESGDGGTVFKLLFPEAQGPAEKAVNTFDINSYKGSGESILVVDDEPQLRNIACEILSSLGYETAEASSGEEAIDWLRQTQADLVILDMLMEPGISGRETYEKILQFNPTQKAIIASGFSESSDVDAALDLGVGAFVKKPYSVQQLCMAVKAELKSS